MASMIRIKKLTIAVEKKILVRDASFVLEHGKSYGLMGCNGSGKSTIAATLMAYPRYEVVQGAIEWVQENGTVDVTKLSVYERARLGMFLIMQYPVEIPGVSLATVTREAFRTLHPTKTMEEYHERVEEALTLLSFNRSFLERSVNEGLSGGEKKISELFQMLVLQPTFIIVDEIDSGLDAEALKRVIRAFHWYKEKHPHALFLIISHYPEFMKKVGMDQFFVMKEGTVVSDALLCVQKEVEKRQDTGSMHV